ncbi:MAG: branched-chain amino acid ABC transporter permease [Candidatus Bathyarchaeia archaeon]
MVFANIIALMAISATLALSITNVPNFAVATFGTIGIYISFTCIKIFGIGLYPSLIFCFLGGGCIGVIIYYLLIRPLRNRGATREELMIATLGLDVLLISLLNIYADYINRTFKIRTRDFILSVYDFNVNGIDGVFIMSTLVFIAVLALLHLMFTKTKIGIAMKALGENYYLAESQGIDAERICLITWFLVGALPATAGGFYPVYWISNPTVSFFIVVSVFASCVLGGFATIYDAATGSYIIGLAQTLLISHLAKIFGSWILPYNFFVALIIMIITLFLFPRGLYGLPWDKIISKTRSILLFVRRRG